MPDLRVMVTCPPMQRTADEWLPTLTDRGIEVELPAVTQHVSRADLLRLLPTCDGIIAGDETLDRPLLAGAPRLRVISRWGVGTDNVDHAAAREFGIVVRNTPAALAEEVADVAIGYVICSPADSTASMPESGPAAGRSLRAYRWPGARSGSSGWARSAGRWCAAGLRSG